MRPTHDRLLGEVGQGSGVSGGGPVVSLREQGSGLGGSEGQVCGRLPRRGGLCSNGTETWEVPVPTSAAPAPWPGNVGDLSDLTPAPSDRGWG
jgi:hypothetical protein